MDVEAKPPREGLRVRGELVFERLDALLSVLPASGVPGEPAGSPPPESEARESFSASQVCGVFLKAQFERPLRRAIVNLGQPIDVARFVCCYRYDPYWMRPKAGRHPAELPTGTLYVLFERNDGSVLLVVPLVDEPFSCCLRGGAAGVELVMDSGDTSSVSSTAVVAYIDVGSNPYALIRRGAAAVAEKLGGTRLRSDKPTPRFVDLFGWCTWDAFYREVSREGVEEGLKCFRAGGVEPRFMILDDGWQSVDADTNEGRLTAFTPNDKFHGDLSSTVMLAKEQFRIEQFLVWHAVYGYWGGTHPEALGEYTPAAVLRWYCPEVLAHTPDMNCEYCGPVTFRPPAEVLPRYYDDYHEGLRAQGVDGVKVDNQASVEGLSHGAGGRVTQMKAMRSALESSVAKHFDGTLINCMSCSAEMLYCADASAVTRTSTDFWPQQAATHGLHVYTNALVSLWFGEFILPDWDMFHSKHPASAFHAAARAVSGGPVYVSDKPDDHDFALLRRLVLSDGSVPRALDVARPTYDSLFVDPTTDSSLFKIYNTNATSYVVAAFNARYDESSKNQIAGNVGPMDIPQLRGKSGTYGIYFVESGQFTTVAGDHHISLTLANLQYEVVVIAPIRDGLAVLGSMDKLNPGGTVVGFEQVGRRISAQFRDGGRALFYCDRRPTQVTTEGETVDILEYCPDTGALIVDLQRDGAQRVVVELPG